MKEQFRKLWLEYLEELEAADMHTYDRSVDEFFRWLLTGRLS